ncbi:NitT/TauT family transport system substrate-binding protein [Mumia flava]|uniref:NitT/TauT family transport system substrate-binding protein n=1 Tax=Mumia flava TaxID=1348852 RepID=A0A0B2BC50_9ACTN|nr:ABC transporter substrate-binding protein [Mumia flava]PJJ57518.1 NitT/TauT family transport system substrate-binding protein [Mumia flava]
MRRLCIAAGLALALSLTGCGGDDDSDSADADGVRTVSVGMLPIVPTAAMYAGIEEGFFEDHGIELEIETGQGGAALLPAVMSQELDFSSSNPVSLLTARDKGLDVRVITNWSDEKETPEEAVNAVIAGADGGLDSAADLEGKTVAVNTLNSMGDLTIREAVRQDGGDPDAVEFLELGFPDMPAALAGGRVDAVWVPEPFMGMLLAEGNVMVTPPCVVAAPGMALQYMFTSGTLAEDDPELVEDMTAALNETLEFAEENPDAVRAQITSVNPNIPEEAAANLKLEGFGTDLRLEQAETIGALMAEEGWIENDPDIDGLFASADQG